MVNKIICDVYFKVNSFEKLDRLLNEFKILIKEPLVIEVKQQYWKDNNLFVVNLFIELKEKSIEKALFNTLLIMNRISSNWQINGPFITQNNYDFSGLSNSNMHMHGIEWIGFSWS